MSSSPQTFVANIKETLAQRVIRVDILAMLFGIGSWIGVNSVYLQLPLIVAHAPEGWALPSYLVVIVQSGNIGPLLYTLLQRYSSTRFNDVYLIYVIKSMACIAAISMAFFYQTIAVIGGQEHSVALLGIAFFFALVGCTSSVLFMPYMGRFREIYLVTYMVGEGLSGFYTSILSLIQGVGGMGECVPNNSSVGPAMIEYFSPPRFETRLFFLLVFAMMVVSATAFTLLNTLPLCKREFAQGTVRNGNDYSYEKNGTAEEDKFVERRDTAEMNVVSAGQYKYLMLLMGAVSLIGSGIFPGIQSFSCIPYGQQAYHLSVTFSSIANPVACFLAIFFNHSSIRHITVLTVLATVIGAYLFTTALMSPTPPLAGTVIGEVLVVSFLTVNNEFTDVC